MKIRQDEFSIFVVNNGCVVRPLLEFSNFLFETKYKKGEIVKSYHISQSNLYRVGDENWSYCHPSKEMLKIKDKFTHCNICGFKKEIK